MTAVIYEPIAPTHLRGVEYRMRCGEVHDFMNRPSPWYHFAYFLDGTVDFEGTEQTVRALPGDLVFLPKGLRYRSLWHGDPVTHYYAAHFVFPLFSEPIGNRTYPMQKLRGTSDLYDDFRFLISAPAEQGGVLEAQARFLHICARLFPHLTYTEGNKIDERVLPAVRYLEEHATEPLRVADLAALCRTSESYFFALFRQTMGMSPIAYKNAVRVRLAEQALSVGDVSMEALSAELGFESSACFRRLFRQMTGQSPGAYRKSHPSEV